MDRQKRIETPEWLKEHVNRIDKFKPFVDLANKIEMNQPEKFELIRREENKTVVNNGIYVNGDLKNNQDLRLINEPIIKPKGIPKAKENKIFTTENILFNVCVGLLVSFITWIISIII